jgi:YgiT-type zinc finger domain-containing protein
MEDRRVTYTLEMDDRFFIIENVPARVCLETGEQFFSPQTIERLQSMIWQGQKPKRVLETPVYEFAAS